MQGSSAIEVEDASLRALAKLEQVLPARLRPRLKSLQDAILPVDMGGAPTAVSLVVTLATACAEAREVQLRYRDLRGVESDRCIEPHRIALYDRRWYLLGWNVASDGWEMLRVDRIEPPISPGRLFARRQPPSDGVSALVSDSVASGWGIEACILLRSPIEEARTRIPPSSGRFETIDESSCRLYTSGTSLEVIAAWMGAFCCDFEIESPPELAEYLKLVAGRLTPASTLRVAPDRQGDRPNRR